VAGGAFAVSCAPEPRRQAIDPIRETSEALGIPLESTQLSPNGVRLHVVQAGPSDGPPVVLLHGMPEFWWGWRHQLPGLVQAGFRVILPDQRGYNESGKPSGAEPYQMAHLAKDIRGLVAALGHESVNLAGHDWGGIVAFQLAIRHPDAIRRLVVLNAFHPFALEEAQSVPDARPEPTIGWYRLLFQLPCPRGSSPSATGLLSRSCFGTAAERAPSRTTTSPSTSRRGPGPAPSAP
jgi:pimeloyl-ACP methyl ester carboxylesterase